MTNVWIDRGIKVDRIQKIVRNNPQQTIIYYGDDLKTAGEIKVLASKDDIIDEIIKAVKGHRQTIWVKEIVAYIKDDDDSQ